MAYLFQNFTISHNFMTEHMRQIFLKDWLKGPVQDRSFAGVHAIKTKTNAGKGFMYATSKVLKCVAHGIL